LACGGSDNTSESVSNKAPGTPLFSSNILGNAITQHRYVINAPADGAVAYSASSSNGSTLTAISGSASSFYYTPAKEGSDVVTITAKGADNAETKGTAVYTVVPNSSPKIDGPISVAVGGIVHRNLATRDEDGDTITWSVNSASGSFITAGGAVSLANGNELTINASKISAETKGLTLSISAQESGGTIATTINSTPSVTINVTFGGGGENTILPDGNITTDLTNQLSTIKGVAHRIKFTALSPQPGDGDPTQWFINDGSDRLATDQPKKGYGWISTEGEQKPPTSKLVDGKQPAGTYPEDFWEAIQKVTGEGDADRPYGEFWYMGTSDIDDASQVTLGVRAVFPSKTIAYRSFNLDVATNTPPRITGTPALGNVDVTVDNRGFWSPAKFTMTAGSTPNLSSRHIVFQSAGNDSMPLTYEAYPSGWQVTDDECTKGDKIKITLDKIYTAAQGAGSATSNTNHTDITTWFVNNYLDPASIDLSYSNGGNVVTVNEPVKFRAPLETATYSGTNVLAGRDLVFRYIVEDLAGNKPEGTAPANQFTLILRTVNNPAPVIDAYDANNPNWQATYGDRKLSHPDGQGWVDMQPQVDEVSTWTINHGGISPQKTMVANPRPDHATTVSTPWGIYMHSNDQTMWKVVPSGKTENGLSTTSWRVTFEPKEELSRTHYEYTLNAWNQFGAKAVPFKMEGEVWGRVKGEPTFKSFYLSSAKASNNGNSVVSYPADFSRWASIKLAPRYPATDLEKPNQYGFDGDQTAKWNWDYDPIDTSAWRSVAVPKGHYLVSSLYVDGVGRGTIAPVVGPPVIGTRVVDPLNSKQVPVDNGQSYVLNAATYAYISEDRPDLTTYTPYGSLAGVVDRSINPNVNNVLKNETVGVYPGYWNWSKLDQANGVYNSVTPAWYDRGKLAASMGKLPNGEDISTQNTEGTHFFNHRGELLFEPMPSNDSIYVGMLTSVGAGSLNPGGVIQFVFRDSGQKVFVDTATAGNSGYPAARYSADLGYQSRLGVVTRSSLSDGDVSNFDFRVNWRPSATPNNVLLKYRTNESENLTLLAMTRTTATPVATGSAASNAATSFNYWTASRTAAPPNTPAIPGAPFQLPNENTNVNNVQNSSFARSSEQGAPVLNAVIERASFMPASFSSTGTVNTTWVSANDRRQMTAGSVGNIVDTLQVLAYTSGVGLGPVDNTSSLPTLLEFGALSANTGWGNMQGTLNLGRFPIPRPNSLYWNGEFEPVLHYTVNWTGTSSLPGSLGIATRATDAGTIRRQITPIKNVWITTGPYTAVNDDPSKAKGWLTNVTDTTLASGFFDPTTTTGVKADGYNNNGTPYYSVWLGWDNPPSTEDRSGTILEIFDMAMVDNNTPAANLAPLFKVHLDPEVNQFPLPHEWVEVLKATNPGDDTNIVFRLRTVRYGDRTTGNLINFNKSPYKQAFPAAWADTITARVNFKDTFCGGNRWVDNLKVYFERNMAGVFTPEGTMTLTIPGLPTATKLKWKSTESAVMDDGTRNIGGQYTYTWSIKGIENVVTATQGTFGTPSAADLLPNSNDLTPPTLTIQTNRNAWTGVESLTVVFNVRIEKNGIATNAEVRADLAAATVSPTFNVTLVNANRHTATLPGSVGSITDTVLQPSSTATAPIQIELTGDTMRMSVTGIDQAGTNVYFGNPGLTYKWVLDGDVSVFGVGNTPINLPTATSDLRLDHQVGSDTSWPGYAAINDAAFRAGLPKVFFVNNGGAWTPFLTGAGGVPAIAKITFSLKCEVYYLGKRVGVSATSMPVILQPTLSWASDVERIWFAGPDNHTETTTVVWGTPSTKTITPSTNRQPTSLMAMMAGEEMTAPPITASGSAGYKWEIDYRNVQLFDVYGNRVSFSLSDLQTHLTTPNVGAFSTGKNLRDVSLTVADAAETPWRNALVRQAIVPMRLIAQPDTSGVNAPFLTSNIYTVTFNVENKLPFWWTSQPVITSNHAAAMGATGWDGSGVATGTPIDGSISFTVAGSAIDQSNFLPANGGDGVINWDATPVSATIIAKNDATQSGNLTTASVVVGGTLNTLALPTISLKDSPSNVWVGVDEAKIVLNAKMTAGSNNSIYNVPVQVTVRPLWTGTPTVVIKKIDGATNLVPNTDDKFTISGLTFPTGTTPLTLAFGSTFLDEGDPDAFRSITFTTTGSSVTGANSVTYGWELDTAGVTVVPGGLSGANDPSNAEATAAVSVEDTFDTLSFTPTAADLTGAPAPVVRINALSGSKVWTNVTGLKIPVNLTVSYTNSADPTGAPIKVIMQTFEVTASTT